MAFKMGRWGQIPAEVQAFLETESFQERFCCGCVDDEDDCPCGLIQGAEHCFRRELWVEVVGALVEVSEMIEGECVDGQGNEDIG